VVSLVSSSFGWSPTAMRGFTIAAGIGFFIALLLAWYHGERGAQKVSGAELVLLSLLLLIGGGLLWKFAPSAPEIALPTAAPILPANGANAENAAEVVRGVGVLPFDNLSPDPDNAFFASGIHEEVLIRVSRINDLRVISRTSMETIAAENLQVSEIGRRLGVSHVLEGSVRRAGNRVRITCS